MTDALDIIPPWVTREPSPGSLRKLRMYGWPQRGPGVDEADLPERQAWPERLVARVGTSGWAYAHWKGRFYPAKLAAPKLLAFYSRRFATIEVNSTYRRLPGPHVFDAWREATPPGHKFTVKSPRSITHDGRLADLAPIDAFYALVRRLEDRLGLVLYQLPPSLAADMPLLERFLDALPTDVRVAMEFRHPTWHAPEYRALLRERGVAWVVHDFLRRDSPIDVTTDFAYLRLHGPSGRYRGSYAMETLLAWAEQAREWMRAGKQVWVYFNNDERGHGARNAAFMANQLGYATSEAARPKRAAREIRAGGTRRANAR